MYKADNLVKNSKVFYVSLKRDKYSEIMLKLQSALLSVRFYVKIVCLIILRIELHADSFQERLHSSHIFLTATFLNTQHFEAKIAHRLWSENWNSIVFQVRK